MKLINVRKNGNINCKIFCISSQKFPKRTSLDSHQSQSIRKVTNGLLYFHQPTQLRLVLHLQNILKNRYLQKAYKVTGIPMPEVTLVDLFLFFQLFLLLWVICGRFLQNFVILISSSTLPSLFFYGFFLQ